MTTTPFEEANTMHSWPKHPRSPNEPEEPVEPSSGAASTNPATVPENRYDNESTELQEAGVAPEGLGLRTGMRSARTVLGFAWFVLVMGTSLLLMGAIIFIDQSAWTPFILVCLVELGFIAAFLVLVNLARRRNLSNQMRHSRSS